MEAGAPARVARVRRLLHPQLSNGSAPRSRERRRDQIRRDRGALASCPLGPVSFDSRVLASGGWACCSWAGSLVTTGWASALALGSSLRASSPIKMRRAEEQVDLARGRSRREPRSLARPSADEMRDCYSSGDQVSRHPPRISPRSPRAFREPSPPRRHIVRTRALSLPPIAVTVAVRGRIGIAAVVRGRLDSDHGRPSGGGCWSIAGIGGPHQNRDTTAQDHGDKNGEKERAHDLVSEGEYEQHATPCLVTLVRANRLAYGPLVH
jgi:hypothetical protein